MQQNPRSSLPEEPYERLRGRVRDLERRFANAALDLGAGGIRLAFAFVFLTFGAQKLFFEPTPVDEPVTTFVTALGVPSAWADAYLMTFVGIYEVGLGTCFLFGKLRAAAALFVPHQFVGFLSLAVVPPVAFNDPIPFAYAGYGAFVLKNVVFVAAFLVLYGIFYGDRSDDSTSDGERLHVDGE